MGKGQRGGEGVRRGVPEKQGEDEGRDGKTGWCVSSSRSCFFVDWEGGNWGVQEQLQ